MKQQEDATLNTTPGSSLVCVRRYHKPNEAQLACLTLQQHGIQCDVVGSDLAVSFSYIGNSLSKIDLIVAQRDVDRAHAVLAEAEESAATGSDDRWGVDGRLGWVCDKCSEVNQQTFDVCWACSEPRAPGGKLAPLPDRDSDQENRKPDSVIAAGAPIPELERSPYAAPILVSGALATESVGEKRDTREALRRRTWRTLVFSAFFPPLAIYAIVLIAECMGVGAVTARLCAALIVLLSVLWLCAAIML